MSMLVVAVRCLPEVITRQSQMIYGFLFVAILLLALCYRRLTTLTKHESYYPTFYTITVGLAEIIICSKSLGNS